LPPPRHARLADYRVDLLPPLNWLPVDDEIVAALDGLASYLRQCGARVELAHPDGVGDLRRHHERYLALMEATASADAPPEERRQRAAAARARAADDPFAAATARGLEASAADYLHWFEERERDRAAYRAFFRDWDILLTPMTCSLPFPHTDAPWEARTLDVNGQTLPYDRAAVYPGLATFSGQPATAFPIGLSRAGLPLGAQAIGPYLEDHTAIHFSALVAEAWTGFRPPPGYP
jgi:amidase